VNLKGSGDSEADGNPGGEDEFRSTGDRDAVEGGPAEG
jgi:hypothetical protein